MIEWGAVAAASFLASAHCIGMCGGLAVAIGATQQRLGPIVARQMIYTLGRVFTYAFLGALGGLAGRSLASAELPFATAQQIFGVVAGLIMVFVGVSTLGLLPARRIPGVGAVAQVWAALFQHFLNARGRLGFFLAGVATGFLPCGLVYAFLAMAAARADPLAGLLWMTAFGIGTAPAMVAIGCGGPLLGRAARVGMLRAAACAMIVMGGVSVYRSIPREAPCCGEVHVRTVGEE